MSVMKHDVNFVFFILIIATVVSFAGFTAYYQISFRNINAEYNGKLAELNQVTKDLLGKKAALLETSLELNTTKQGREELGARYGDLKDERDTLEGERDTARDERDSYKENLIKTKAELEQKKSQVTSLSVDLAEWKDKAADYKSDRDYYEEKFEACEDVAEGLGGSC